MKAHQGAVQTSPLSSYWPVALVVIVAAVLRCFIRFNSDVSWLLTLAEQVLAGARAYVDFTEPNPPASILIYMPAVELSRLANISAEVALTVLVFAGALVSLWLAGRCLGHDSPVQQGERPLLFALACALLLILPGDNFAERENIALISILPMIAVYARRMEGASPGAALAFVAGIGGGIAIAIKPYFALALLLPLPLVAWSSRKSFAKMMAVLFAVENLATAIVVLAYGAILVWGFPDYSQHTLPLVLTLYVPLRYSLPLMLANPSVIMVVLAGLVGAGLGIKEYRSPVVAVTSLAALGFTGALIIQGKGWPYHGYPPVALSLLVLCILLVRRFTKFMDTRASVTKPSADVMFGSGLLLCLYALASFWLLQEPSREYLVTVVSRMVPDHPKVFSIYGAPGLAFPLTRRLHGAPLGRTPFQWISAYTDRMLTAGELDPTGRKVLDPALRRTIEDFARRDRAELADTIRTREPDVIIVGGNGEELWALSYPEIAAALRPYYKAKTVGDAEIWLPRKAPGAKP